MNGFSRGMEESRPFPRLGSPPDSNASSPTPSSVESYGERDLGVHPGEKVFNFPGGPSSDSGGPVTLTSLTPISPSNEDVHSAEQYRSSLIPNISRLGTGGPPPFFTYLSSHQPTTTIFPIMENEKFKKMWDKKMKKKNKKEKNVMTVMRSEDIDGHKTEDSIDSILESIGEQVDEEKKNKGRKLKDKSEKPKTVKKDKRKSLDDVENSKDSNKESESEDYDDDEKHHQKNKSESPGVKFQDNFYVLSSVNDNKSQEDPTTFSPQSNFTKVTSKKSRGRRGKEEVGKPPPPLPPPTVSQKTLSRSGEQERKDSLAAPQVESSDTDQQKYPRLEQSDFPALPGGILGPQSCPLPGPWGKPPTKASDSTPDNTDNEEDHDSAACDEAPAVIVPEVPSEVVSSEDLYDSDNNNNNNNVCDDKVKVLTCPEEFEKKVVSKDSPVVIFSEEDGKAWNSSEFTFGFDVNEELLASATVPLNNRDPTPVKVQELPQEMYLPYPAIAPIDTVDGAILDFGVAATMRPLIVGVPVGVPVPASSFPLYSNHIVQPFPPYGGLTYPQLAEQDLKTVDHDQAAVSPESGISSSSPLSWHPESSPQLVSHSQVTESLSNWSGHMSEEETDQDSGLTSCHSGKTENRFNFVEIVNYVSSSWCSVSEDQELQVFTSGPQTEPDIKC